MVLEGFQLILDYHSSMPRNFCGFQVRRQSWSRSRFRTKGVPGTLFRFCLHAYCFHLMQCLGRSSSTISGEPIPRSERRSFGSVVKPRRRARACPPQARECRGGPPHPEVRLACAWRPRTSCPRPISVGPSFCKQLWQVPGGRRGSRCWNIKVSEKTS